MRHFVFFAVCSLLFLSQRNIGVFQTKTFLPMLGAKIPTTREIVPVSRRSKLSSMSLSASTNENNTTSYKEEEKKTPVILYKNQETLPRTK